MLMTTRALETKSLKLTLMRTALSKRLDFTNMTHTCYSQPNTSRSVTRTHRLGLKRSPDIQFALWRLGSLLFICQKMFPMGLDWSHYHWNRLKTGGNLEATS